jgi:hypothetical protein
MLENQYRQEGKLRIALLPRQVSPVPKSPQYLPGSGLDLILVFASFTSVWHVPLQIPFVDCSWKLSWYPWQIHFCDMICTFNCNWVDTQWQQYSTHLHTNNTQDTENGTYITITKLKIPNNKKLTNLGSTGCAPSLRVIPWHLPYKWGKSTEKPQLDGYNGSTGCDFILNADCILSVKFLTIKLLPFLRHKVCDVSYIQDVFTCLGSLRIVHCLQSLDVTCPLTLEFGTRCNSFFKQGALRKI